MLLFCKIKESLEIATMTRKQDKTLKKFGLISAILFSSILVISVYVLNNCSSFGNCGFINSQIISIIFISIGGIGTGYCLIIVRGFDDKIDSEILENIKELNDYNNNGAESDKDKKLLSY